MVTVYSATGVLFAMPPNSILINLVLVTKIKMLKKDQKYAQESVAKSNQMGIPVIDIDGTIIVGFDRPKIDAALKAHAQK